MALSTRSHESIGSSYQGKPSDSFRQLLCRDGHGGEPSRSGHVFHHRRPQDSVGTVSSNVHGQRIHGPCQSRADKGTEWRNLRRQLETLHVAGAPNAVDTAWKYLGHNDRNIRYAARIAIEHQPVESWQEKALGDAVNNEARINALLALARCGDASLQPRLLESLAKVDAKTLNEDQKLAALRVLSLCFIRMGRPADEVATDVAAILNAGYPAASTRLNRELCALLVYLNDKEVAGKTLELMKKATTQEEQLHYALCLRALKENWTLEQRTQYFNWFVDSTNFEADIHSPGSSRTFDRKQSIRFPRRIKLLSRKCWMLDQNPPRISSKPHRGHLFATGKSTTCWRRGSRLKGRNFENGRKMFTVTACYKCHRFAGDGGIVGPELTAVGRRYNARTMLEALIEPSK